MSQSAADGVVGRKVDHVLAARDWELHALEHQLCQTLEVGDAGGEDAEQEVEEEADAGHEEGHQDQDQEPEDASQPLVAVGHFSCFCCCCLDVRC